MVTLKALRTECAQIISPINDENPRYEAAELVMKATGVTNTTLLTEPDLEVSDEAAQSALAMARRRASGEPLQYILGEWEFYGLPFEVGDGVLIPRQDTETLVELAREHIKSGMLCADLCAGSGCIGISVSRKDTEFISYEKSPLAMNYLKRNIEKNKAVTGKITPLLADVLDDSTINDAPVFDIILSNPPYLTAEDMAELQAEVLHEPEMALFGGDDGLYFYREILRLWTPKLKSGGLFAVEIGMGHEKDVAEIFRENGISPQQKKDYCGVYRVVYGFKK